MAYREGPVTGTSGEALPINRRVKFGGSTWTLAGVEIHHGTVVEPAITSGDRVSVRACGPSGSGGGTCQMTASGVISAGAAVYPAASGKVTATVQGRQIGIALVAAAADGDWIEVLETPMQSGQVVAEASAILDHASFTDGGSTAGTMATGVQIPAGAICLGYKAEVSEAFAGDTTGTLEVGDAGDADRFSGATDPSVYTTGTKNSELPAGQAFCATASDVIIKITGTADWGNVTAGKIKITMYYVQP